MTLIGSTKPGPWTLSPQMTAAPELWRDVVACWPFWEGQGSIARDLSGNGNHAELNGSVTWTSGPTGSRVDIPGSADFLKVPNPRNIPAGNAGDSIYFFMLMEFDVDANNLSEKAGLFQYYNGSDGHAVRLEASSDGGAATIIWRTSGGNSAKQGIVPLQQQVGLSGRWDQQLDFEHVFQIDGAPTNSSQNSDTSSVDDSTPFYLGVANFSSGDPTGDTLDGKIDFAVLWNGTKPNLLFENVIPDDPFAMLRPREF